MVIEENFIRFDTGRRIFCKEGMFFISENGFLLVFHNDYLIRSYQLSPKEIIEIREYYVEKIILIDQMINEHT